MALPSKPAGTASAAEAVLFDLVDRYDRAYEQAAGAVSLTAAQACVLGRLDEERGMGEMAGELGCDASNITQIVVRLEALGLVTRYPDPADRRARLLARTAAGDARNGQFEKVFGFAREAVGRLSGDERHQLVALLGKALGHEPAGA